MYEDRMKFVEHKGKRILETNFRSMTIEQLPEFSEEFIEIVSKEAQGSVLSLVDVTDFHFSVKAVGIFNKNSERTKLYDKACAIVGTTGLLKVMYDGFAKFFKMPLKACNSREEALDWLASL